jgi:hypothetical protein
MPMWEATYKWVFGTSANAAGGNSTGSGSGFRPFGGPPRENTFYVEASADCTCSYQIRTARESTGPWSVLSSGTLSSNTVDVWQYTGPFLYFSPRIKTLKSTGDNVTVEYVGN